MDDRLKRAIIDGNFADVRLYVRSAAEADAREGHDMTPLELAIEHMQLDVIRYLLGLGADANLRDHYGQTPLHFAVDIECEDARYREDIEGVAYAPRATITRILVEHGADPTIAALDGWSPADWARDRHHAEALALLANEAPGRGK